TTVAGNATNSGFAGDGGLATAAELFQPKGIAFDTNGNLYIADTNNNVIREVDHTTGNISTIAGNTTYGSTGDGGLATSAELAGPSSIAVDSAGNVFIADSDNNEVREVSATTHNISTIAGNGTAGYMGDNGPATAAELSEPEGIALDSNGN